MQIDSDALNDIQRDLIREAAASHIAETFSVPAHSISTVLSAGEADNGFPSLCIDASIVLPESTKLVQVEQIPQNAQGSRMMRLLLDDIQQIPGIETAQSGEITGKFLSSGRSMGSSATHSNLNNPSSHAPSLETQMSSLQTASLHSLAGPEMLVRSKSRSCHFSFLIGSAAVWLIILLHH
jgi:hypothetical protein